MKVLNQTLTAAAIGAVALTLSGAALADNKIATIRVTDVVQQSPQFKAGADKIKTEADVMSPADRAKSEKDLTARQVDLQYKQRQFQEDFKTRDQQLTTDMMNKIKTVIEAVARERGVDAVLQDPVFSTPAVDITDDVLKRLQAGTAADPCRCGKGLR
jgi:outer membrane protein